MYRSHRGFTIESIYKVCIQIPESNRVDYQLFHST